MTVRGVIGAIVAGAILLLGVLLGRPLGRSEGRKEGAATEKAGQELKQSKAGAESAVERTRVEIDVSRTADDDIDGRLSKHSRPD